MIFKELYLFLKENGVEVYSIGQHNGICDGYYVVIKENGTTGSVLNYKIDEIELILYGKFEAYTVFLDYIDKITNLTKKIKKIKRIYEAQPIVYDDEKKAYTTSLFFKIDKFYE